MSKKAEHQISRHGLTMGNEKVDEMIDEIRARHERAKEDARWEWTLSGFMAHKDRAALLSHVEALEGEVKRLQHWERTAISNRDTAREQGKRYITEKGRRDKVEAKLARLVEGLEMLAEGTTPWMETDQLADDAWEVMARYARELLKAAREEA